MIQYIQLAILVILLDRNLILRNRFKLAIEHQKPNRYGRGNWALWVYCKLQQGEEYSRLGGKRLFYFEYGKQGY